MKPLTNFDEKYFDKYKTKPVKIKPYDPKQKIIANKYIRQIEKLLKDSDVEILVRGSTAYEILGKGDVEVGVYVKSKEWKRVLGALKKKYGEANNMEEDYARFNIDDKGLEVEIIVLKGYEARLDRALTLYLQDHADLLEKYKQLKEHYKYSKREYQIQKNKFFIKVSKLIPDDFLKTHNSG